jgi:leader peptidase (prepilin peptidase)/N-methyltransferase
VTWLWLRGQCANCKKEISMRYFLVEALTGTVFALCWLFFGHASPASAAVHCILIAGLIAATFIDFEHFIIPDEITIGGMVAGLILAFFVPASHLNILTFHPYQTPGPAMRDSVAGMVVGAGVVYGILRLGKLLFGRYKLALAPGTRILFTETALKLPQVEMPFEELFYRPGDTIRIEAEQVELIDRCYKKVELRLQPKKLRIGQDTFDPEKVLHLEAVADHVVLPREAMGLGDVKFMAAIGAFLGWPAVLFSLALSSVIGSVTGIALIALRRREWSARMPYGPYIAVAAVIWIFGGYKWLKMISP